MTFKCLNPRGEQKDIPRLPLCPRRDISGKNVYFIDIVRPNSDVLMDAVRELLQPLIADSRIVLHGKTTGYRYEEPQEWWDAICDDAAAAVFFVGDCGSCTMRMLTLQSRLEQMGVPTVSLVCTPFLHDAAAVARTLGMPSLRYVEIPYPVADISRDELLRGVAPALPELSRLLTSPLTEDEQSRKTISAAREPEYIFEGGMAEIQDFFANSELSDGLPIVPPTDEAVEAMLKGTSHAPDEVIGEMPPEFLRFTVRHVAINGVMCGCRPEHMPALLAICEILCDPAYDLNVSSRSTTAFAFWGFVNGPYAREIGMNCGANALGPGNRANAALGRAIRMFIINLGGSRVGINEMATIGNPMKYGFAFAENEEESPWQPYHMDKGFRPEESTVTVCESWGFRTQALTGQGEIMGLETVLWSAKNTESAFGLGRERGILVLLDPLLASQLSEQGVDKKYIKQYLWENCTRTVGEWKNCLCFSSDVRGGLYPAETLDLPDDTPIPKFQSPESVQVIVVGGGNSPFYHIYDSVNPHHCMTKSIDKWR